MLENILSYDYHPLIVHIPIAFLTVYSLFEIITTLFFASRFYSFVWTKLLLLGVGVFGAQGALFTGEMAEDLNREIVSRKILDAHEEWASFTFSWFLVIFIIYILIAVASKPFFKTKIDSIVDRFPSFNIFFGILKTIGNFFSKYKVFVLGMSIVGLVTVSVTGALGGVMVYGRNADPIVIIVLKFLGL